MDIENDDINIDTVSFVPAVQQTVAAKKSKKRAISEGAGEQMQVDLSGIEGTVRTAPRPKRKRQNSLELRKIPVPPHRCVVVVVVNVYTGCTILSGAFRNASTSCWSLHNPI